MRMFAYKDRAASRPVNCVSMRRSGIYGRHAMRACLSGFVCALVVAAALFSVGPARAAELIMIEEAGCPWCDRWDDEIGVVYNKTAEGRAAPLRRIDIADRLPNDLTFLQKGRYTPTFVLVADGREFGRIRGYPGEDFFWPMLQELLQRLPDEPEKDLNNDTPDDGS